VVAVALMVASVLAPERYGRSLGCSWLLLAKNGRNARSVKTRVCDPEIEWADSLIKENLTANVGRQPLAEPFFLALMIVNSGLRRR
jgi:hypothetical protein